jgi:hypothetical protein
MATLGIASFEGALSGNDRAGRNDGAPRLMRKQSFAEQ